MIINDIKNYFNSNCFKPFLAYVDDENYLLVKKEVESLDGIATIRISDFCNGIDKKPDLDSLRERFRELDVDYSTNRYLLIGLGEYLSLEGLEKAKKFLNELVFFNLGTAHIVCLIKGCRNILTEINNSDIRMKRQVSVDCKGPTLLKLTLSPIDLNMYSLTGLKSVLTELENGNSSEIFANSSLEFPNAMTKITYVKNYYQALVDKYNIKLSIESYDEKYWECLWNELNLYHSLEKIFEVHSFALDFSENFYSRISKECYENWLYLIYLHENKKNITNSYLKLTIEQSKNISSLKNNILNYISTISYKDSHFDRFYIERKNLIKYFLPEELAYFVSENRKNIEESIYKLTDCSKAEKQEIIAYISQYGIPKNLSQIYPDLNLYLKDYHFTDSSIKEILTDYFNEYKREKVKNELSKEFIEVVNKYALSKKYNVLPSRNELVMQAKEDGTFLCWIDALGVEYLSYIVELAKQKGLMCSIKVGRADLPTITSINKGFYENWSTDNKIKITRVDELKHKECSEYRYGPSNLYPIHLTEELDEIKKVINDAALQLALHNYKKYVIASDHGASRLAVIAKKEEPYDTDTKGEHSGRCCKVFENYNLQYASEENGYIILADYGRFRGSRAANVEVHGGASLEEVIVPVISLSLMNDRISFSIVEEVVQADRKIGTDFTLFSKNFINEDVYIEFNGSKTKGNLIDNNHWKFTIPDIKRAGDYSLNIFVGENLVSGIELHAIGKIAILNTDFDELF